MKKLLFTLFSLGILLAFSACSSDDDNKEQKFLTEAKVQQSISLVAEADHTVTTPLRSNTLNELLKGTEATDGSVYDGLAAITKGDFQVGLTTVKVVGIPAGITLKDLKININGKEHSFGDITNNNADLYINKNVDFFSKAFNRIMSSKKMETKVTFTPSETTTEDVKLEIIFVGSFSYWVKI